MFIYELAGNRIILETMELYWHHLRRAMREVLKERSVRKDIWEEHAAILEAIAAGDAAQAQARARRHLQNATTALHVPLPA
ncbi:MAG: FCD domain-containing protein, partial [Pseudomonadota bacterium]